MATYRALPYGISDFRRIRRENYYLVDKSSFITKLEETASFLFLIRPRRFGKSLFLSMLRYYYDIAEKDNFQELFKGLWIAEHPTWNQGRFQVMHIDFSQIGGTIDELTENFDGYMRMKFTNFARKYAAYYPKDYLDELNKYSSASDIMNYVHDAAKDQGCSLYLIVDEYDNFTNTVLNEKGENIYHAMTHASGFYRDVFKKFKGNYDRILMMGVSPVTLDDLTSGYNIATSITMDSRFNQMLGFSETEVREMIRYYQEAGVLQADEEQLITEMKPWYDGYCFSDEVIYTDPKMFNCDMVTYYLNSFIQNGRAPKEMIDRNTSMDYAKLNNLIKLDQLDGDRKGVLLEIAEKGSITGKVANSFPAAQLTDPEMFKSLLFYYGMLTFTDDYGIEQELGIPNNNVRKQYYEFLLREYQNLHPIDLSGLIRCYREAALNGNWHPMMDYILQAYHDTTSVRSLIEGERNLQGFMNAYLNLNTYYLTAPEVELNHGYCDFFLMPDLIRWPMVKHSYILELKYLSISDTEEKAEKQWAEAIKQIKQYGQGKKVQLLTSGTQLHLIVAQIQGYEKKRVEEISLPVNF
ncbi:ATP-binding protein [Phocaeicola salanitronis]|uniref:ATP-binding protein n=1 Tax=Phocaeicola salanitronis TaxID=376805 RepID=UPI001C397EB3|nr:ATP-binding protein [Phocaeicola salanitronis]MDM8305773.1 ATP-binding protein [Phocaeicola salanitronis]HJC98768.1 ATP-binding protein [Candidatus Phocaeicola merdavium]